MVGNSLILSATDSNKVLEINLKSYETPIFKDLSDTAQVLGPIDYEDGAYYLCLTRKVNQFTKSGDVRHLCALDISQTTDMPTLDRSRITGIVAFRDTAYVTTNMPGRIHRIDLKTGDSEVFVNGLNYPAHLEFLPSEMQPPETP